MRRAILLILVFASLNAFAGTGRIIIVESDPQGAGFKDQTPALPVAGNLGTTRGQQRLNVFLAAAEGWRKYLDTNVDIVVTASFASIPGCTASDAILGRAAPNSWRHSFPNAPSANVWYPIALANKYAGTDLEPTQPDIFVQFNADVDNATCLGTASWYYGFDGNEGSNIDLYTVVSHELAHGLGVAGATGAPEFLQNRPAITDVHTLDLTLGLRWDQMTPEQRRVSVTNTGNLVWDGAFTKGAASRFLEPVTMLTLTEPSVIARNYDIGTAAFGPPATTALSGKLVRATDEANADGPTLFDGCTAFTNAAAISGNLAVIDRGTCPFVTKVRNAQTAGATGVVIADRAESYFPINPSGLPLTCLPPGMAGEATDLTIPVISVGVNDANSIRNQFTAEANVSGLLRVDPSQLAGTSKEGYVRLYAPCTIAPGSSIHHFDITATPNLLMEPSINDDLSHDPDLTLFQLLDIGWAVRTGRRFLTR